MDERPLFIPLTERWFREFEAGTKTVEYRAYGPRWNETTCRIGRAAVLSLGYSKGTRMTKVVKGFRRVPRAEAPQSAREIFRGTEFMAAIELE